MAVRASSTGTKILSVLDAVARHQPIGVSELSRLLHEDKSMVQRMLVTLADDGWIGPAPSRTTKWQATNRLRILADIACVSVDFRSAAAEMIRQLRDRTGETVSLVVRDGNRFIVTDVAESEQTLRVAHKIGRDVPGPVSASSLAVLPYLSRQDQESVFGTDCTVDLATEGEKVRSKGFGAVESELGGGTVSIASAVLDASGHPVAVVVLSAPEGRALRRARDSLGQTISEAAKSISGL